MPEHHASFRLGEGRCNGFTTARLPSRRSRNGGRELFTGRVTLSWSARCSPVA